MPYCPTSSRDLLPATKHMHKKSVVLILENKRGNTNKRGLRGMWNVFFPHSKVP